MKEPYPKYLLEDHDFELVESKVNHNLGGYDYSLDVFECSVCDYRKTDNYRELTENGILFWYITPVHAMLAGINPVER